LTNEILAKIGFGSLMIEVYVVLQPKKSLAIKVCDPAFNRSILKGEI
jgi:hypothetical protein